MDADQERETCGFEARLAPEGSTTEVLADCSPPIAQSPTMHDALLQQTKARLRIVCAPNADDDDSDDSASRDAWACLRDDAAHSADVRALVLREVIASGSATNAAFTLVGVVASLGESVPFDASEIASWTAPQRAIGRAAFAAWREASIVMPVHERSLLRATLSSPTDDEQTSLFADLCACIDKTPSDASWSEEARRLIALEADPDVIAEYIDHFEAEYGMTLR